MRVRDESLQIPDAKRRLPHWSSIPRAPFPDQPYSFQTPKGVCLIGVLMGVWGEAHASDSRRQKASASLECPRDPRPRNLREHSRRQKASASLEFAQIAADVIPNTPIPDAKRRLPHWSFRRASLT